MGAPATLTACWARLGLMNPSSATVSMVASTRISMHRARMLQRWALGAVWRRVLRAARTTGARLNSDPRSRPAGGGLFFEGAIHARSRLGGPLSILKRPLDDSRHVSGRNQGTATRYHAGYTRTPCSPARPRAPPHAAGGRRRELRVRPGLGRHRLQRDGVRGELQRPRHVRAGRRRRRRRGRDDPLQPLRRPSHPLKNPSHPRAPPHSPSIP